MLLPYASRSPIANIASVTARKSVIAEQVALWSRRSLRTVEISAARLAIKTPSAIACRYSTRGGKLGFTFGDVIWTDAKPSS